MSTFFSDKTLTEICKKEPKGTRGPEAPDVYTYGGVVCKHVDIRHFTDFLMPFNNLKRPPIRPSPLKDQDICTLCN